MSEVDENKYSAMVSLFPEMGGWVYFEENDNASLEEEIKHHGKWVIYDSEQKIKNLANRLRKEIGNDLRTLKYSMKPTKVTPNAPEGKYALLAYCHEAKKDKVLTMLKKMGVSEVTWKYDRESFVELFDNTSFYLRLELLSPGELENLAELLQIKLDSESLKRAKDFRKYVEGIAEKLGKLDEMIKAGVDSKIIEQKFDEYFKKQKSI